MTVERIEFSLTPLAQGYPTVYPPPYPANKEVPAWFRSMPIEADTDGEAKLKSVRNCPPFLEAMTCGYIIPLAADIELAVDPTAGFQGRSWNVEIVKYHVPSQVKGAPFERFPIVKILNPWLIRTPAGYSTLFQPLINRFELPQVPLAGLV